MQKCSFLPEEPDPANVRDCMPGYKYRLILGLKRKKVANGNIQPRPADTYRCTVSVKYLPYLYRDTRIGFSFRHGVGGKQCRKPFPAASRSACKMFGQNRQQTDQQENRNSDSTKKYDYIDHNSPLSYCLQ